MWWPRCHADIPFSRQTIPPGWADILLPAPAPNLSLVTTGAELQLANNVSFGLKFDGEFSDFSQTYAGTGTVRYVW